MDRSRRRQDLRFYGGLLMAAALAGAVVNALHPITTGSLTDTAAGIAANDGWILLHVAISLTLLMLAAGLVGIGTVTIGTPGEALARVALLFTAVGVTLALISLAIDGVSLKVLANAWTGAGTAASQIRLDAFLTVKHINNALWSTTVLVFFGLAIVANGFAVQASRRYPGWAAWGALLGGGAAIVAAVIQLPAGGESRLGEMIFTGSAALISLWSLALGLTWWRTAALESEVAVPAA